PPKHCIHHGCRYTATARGSQTTAETITQSPGGSMLDAVAHAENVATGETSKITSASKSPRLARNRTEPDPVAVALPFSSMDATSESSDSHSTSPTSDTSLPN